VISFLEVNTRLQVEHPVTEETSGIDLVREQFRIAAGLPVSITEDPAPQGHAIEFRLNAEDAGRGFLPSPGPVDVFEAPTGAGVRVDTGVRSGSRVPAEYDSLMAKLIVHGEDRAQALRRARAALDELRIEGLPTVVPFHRAVVRDPDFTHPDRLGVYTTWIESAFAGRLDAALSSGAAGQVARRETLTVEIDGRAVQLGLPAEVFAALMNGGNGTTGAVLPSAAPGTDVDGTVTASMGGTLVKWLADDGATIGAGQPVAVLEAMKMETEVLSKVAGTFRRGGQEPGAAVARGEVLGAVG